MMRVKSQVLNTCLCEECLRCKVSLSIINSDASRELFPQHFCRSTKSGTVSRIEQLMVRNIGTALLKTRKGPNSGSTLWDLFEASPVHQRPPQVEQLCAVVRFAIDLPLSRKAEYTLLMDGCDEWTLHSRGPNQTDCGRNRVWRRTCVEDSAFGFLSQQTHVCIPNYGSSV